MTSVSVIGLGASGLVVAQELIATKELGATQTVGYFDTDPDRMAFGARTLESATPATALGSEADVVVLATPAGGHAIAARRLLEQGSHVVSLSDSTEDVIALLALDGLAKRCNRTLLVGVGMAPGLSCLLATHAGNALDEVEEIAVAKTGTAGPACARQHHRALKRQGRDWISGEWAMRRGGSGRELLWFPDPIGALDCYRANLASPLLLQRVYPQAGRISARMSANRRDRLTFRLPMLRTPHADGGPGGIRIEVRGLRNGAFETLVYGVTAHPSRAAGVTSAIAAQWLLQGDPKPGATGVAEVARPLDWLQSVVDRGVHIVAIGDPIHDNSAPTGQNNHPL